MSDLLTATPDSRRRNDRNDWSDRNDRNDPHRMTDLLTATPDNPRRKHIFSADPADRKRLNSETSSRSRPSSLQQLQALDLFNKKFSDSESFMLETDNYVRQIRQRRGALLKQMDAGHAIERKLVRVLQERTMRKKSNKHKQVVQQSNPFSKITSWRRRSKNYRNHHHRYYRHHHRFCIKCVTSSFAALFRYMLRPVMFVRDKDGDDTEVESLNNGQSRAPSPKMFLGRDGRLQWPVFQYGGASGTGMLLSSEGMFPSPKANNADPPPEQPGRENFSLGAQKASNDNYYSKQEASVNNNNKKRNKQGKQSEVIDVSDRRLLGWLQVRDPKNKRQYIPVVDPAPEGPFRKAPWHGNMQIMKF